MLLYGYVILKYIFCLHNSLALFGTQYKWPLINMYIIASENTIKFPWKYIIMQPHAFTFNLNVNLVVFGSNPNIV